MLVVRSIILGLVENDWNSPGPHWYYFGASREIFIVLAAGAGAALLAVLWALFVYKPRRLQSHHRYLGSGQPQRAVMPSTNGENGAAHRRQWRRRRREPRPRNPTLAERGGLPPLRSERPSEPFS